MKKGNPFISKGLDTTKGKVDSQVMTVGGTVVKSLILMVVLAASFLYSFEMTIYNYKPALTGATLIGFFIAMATTFMPKIAQYTAIIYAACEGFALGALSNLLNNIYDGIASQAILMTIVVAIVTLLIYRAVPTFAEKIRKMVFIGIISVAAVSLISALMSLFGVMSPIYGNGGIGIGFSLIVIVLAAMSLMTDFDNITKAASYGAPKYMEWYCAFGLTVTLIWLYTEILNLLAKVSSRD